MAIPLLVVIFSSCDDKAKYFEDERYVKELFFVSNANNIHEVEYYLSGKEYADGDVSVGVSGSNPIDQDVTAELTVDPDFVDQYNRSLYLDDRAKYVKTVDPSDYQIPSTTVHITAGKNPAAEYGLMNVKIKEEIIGDFIPDSAYFLGFKFVNSSPYAVKEGKDRLLYRIHKRNKYASTKVGTFYTSTGYQGNGYFGVQKQILPLTSNTCRFTVGSTVFSASNSYQVVVNKSMVVTINEDNSLSYSSYKGGVAIRKLTPSDDPNDASYYYRNVYNEEEKTFYLYYQYSTNGGGSFTEPIREMVTLDQ